MNANKTLGSKTDNKGGITFVSENFEPNCTNSININAKAKPNTSL